MKEILKMSLFLFLVCSVAAAALALTDRVTAERIERNRRAAEAEARKAVLGDLAYARCSARTATLRDGTKATLHEYFDAEDRRVAIVVKGDGKGFGGRIEFMLGVDAEGRVLGVEVVSHAETPGLGTKVTDGPWLGRLRGLGAAETALARDEPGGKVDAITGVTVSSRAMTRGVRTWLERLSDAFDE